MIFLGIFLGASLTTLAFQIITLVYILKNPKFKKMELARKIEQKQVENEILKDISKMLETLDELASDQSVLNEEIASKEKTIQKYLED